MSDELLVVRNLVTEFRTSAGTIRAVDDVSIDIGPGEIVGVVGESGSGKSTLAMSILGLVQSPGRVTHGRVEFQGRDLLSMPGRELRQLRGKEIGVVFQDPLSSLNPVLKIGVQIGEAIRAHDDVSSNSEIRDRVIASLRVVGIPHPETARDQYPFELSGGMRQRVMIAIAACNGPRLLIADEPTTALDVTTQAQVIETLKAAQQQTRAATMLISHNLALVAEIADRVVVMYAGHVVEATDIETIFSSPKHPYTIGLMMSLPRIDTRVERLLPIPGNPPSLTRLPPGCPFQPRCSLSRARGRCVEERPTLREVGAGHRCACHFAEETGSVPSDASGGAAS